MKSARPAIIFDFDGTIADSLVVTLQIMYELVHHQPLPTENISDLRAKGTWHLLHALRIPVWKAVGLLPRVRRRLNFAAPGLMPIAGIEAVIRTLAKTHQLFILSAGDQPGIQAFLKRHNLADCFVSVYGDATAWHKAPPLRRLVRRAGLDPATTWYVGDRSWDVRAARAAGLHSVAVTWGFNNVQVLRRARPDRIAFTPDELLNAVRGKSHE